MAKSYDLLHQAEKKAAGQAGIGSEIPKDAIPELEMPSFIESSSVSNCSKDEIPAARQVRSEHAT